MDDDGYPVSARIAPEPNNEAQVLRIIPPAGLELHAGPASVLGHSHDEETWNLKSFLARGQLEHDESGWAFRPVTFIPGPGTGNPLEQLKTMARPPASAKRYLERRHLPRPTIPWDNIKRSY